MHVELGLNQGGLRRWHVDLASRLGDVAGVTLGIRWTAPQGEPLPSCLSALLMLEGALHGRPSPRAEPALPADLSAWVGSGGTEPDLVIDLAGGSPAAGRRRWSLRSDGLPGDAPSFAALLEGRAPVIALVDAVSGSIVASARPALGDAEVVGAGFDRVLSRTLNLIVAAVRGRASSLRLRETPAKLTCGATASFGARSLARTAFERLNVIARQAPHTRTGWRLVNGPDMVDLGAHPATGWQVLPDDGRRSYGQPFPIVVRGETWLFVAERDYVTDRQLISAVRFDEAGPLGTPVPVLEAGDGVAFPYVFESEGTIWMVPQTLGASGIDLYRASRFPGGWRHEARLVEGVETTDATPFRFNGRWWMTATVRDGGSPSDMLHVWSAPSVRGPWRAHPRNPVLIDAATARAAGRVVQRHGRVIRPVQDRRDGRNRVLALAEITRLDEDGFEQRVVGTVPTAPVWPGRGISTMNRAGSLECIDGADFPVFLERARPRRSRGPAREHPGFLEPAASSPI